ncbi:hypothetical protein VULLAG_LOCUS11073 [Vulpes lagopus]
MYCTPNELKVSFRPGRFRLWMSMFTVVLFVHELKGKQASPVPATLISACLLLTTQLGVQGPTGPWREPLAGWRGGGVGVRGVFVTQQLRNPPKCETTAIPSST